LVIGKLYLGGQSYGGRQASILAASESSLISGLLLLSYPLHPPGRPNQQRTEHFPSLRTPALFVSGTNDAFGSVEELETAIKPISARTQFVQIPDAGHGLVTKKNASSVPGTIVEAFTAMFLLIWNVDDARDQGASRGSAIRLHRDLTVLNQIETACN
jgi:predicted alpha/beta-hydrolase family hydrolase